MNWISITWISFGVVLCALPAFLMRGNLVARLAVFACTMLVSAGAWLSCLRWAANIGFLAFAFTALVPIGITAFVLVAQRGRRRKVGVTLLLVMATLLAYFVIAARFSNARNLYDGVVDLPSFISGQSWVRDSLNDPDSARFRDLWFYKYRGKWQMCGDVNARNRMGGLVGFTSFYLEYNDVLHSVTFDPNGEHFDDFMRHCYGDDWAKPRPPSALPPAVPADGYTR